MVEMKTKILSTNTQRLYSLTPEKIFIQAQSKIFLFLGKIERILRPLKINFFLAATQRHPIHKIVCNRIVVLKSGIKKCEKVLKKKLFLSFSRFKGYQPYTYEIFDYESLNREILAGKLQKLILKKIVKDLQGNHGQVLKRFCLLKIAQIVRVKRMRAFYRLQYMTQVLSNTTTTVEIVKNITIVEKYVKICEKSGGEIVMSQRTKVLVERENENGEILAPAEVQYDQTEEFFEDENLRLKNTEDSSELALINSNDQLEPYFINNPTTEKNKTGFNALVGPKRRSSFYKEVLLKIPLGVAFIVFLLFIYKKIRPLLVIVN